MNCPSCGYENPDSSKFCVWMCLVAGLACGIVLASSGSAARAQSVEAPPEPAARAALPSELAAVLSWLEDGFIGDDPYPEGRDAGVISTCALYYQRAARDCSHIGPSRVPAPRLVPSFIEPSPTVSSRLELYASRMAHSRMSYSRMTPSQISSSQIAPSELTSIRTYSGRTASLPLYYVETSPYPRYYVSTVFAGR